MNTQLFPERLNFIVVRVLDIIKPLSGILPSIRTPKRPVSGNEKVFWTLVCLFIFLVCSQIPIFGVTMNSSADPFYWARVMLASNKGSLMELGISPIMTASMIMHFLVGLKAIACDMSLSEDRELYNDAQKWLSLVICFGTSIAYVLSGAFGKISLFVSVIIITQLLTSGVIVMLMDDLLTKGYGFGGGVSMFITTSICEKLVWSMFSPTTLHTKNGTEFEGAFVALMHFLIVRKNKLIALKEAFYRESAINITNVLATLTMLGVIIYLQCFRVDIPIKHRTNGGQVGVFPVKLFYTHSSPMLIQTTLTSHLFYLSHVLYRQMRSNPFVNLLGQWQELPNGRKKPIGGLSYYIHAPMSAKDYVTQPFHTVIYVLFAIISCAFISKLYLDIINTGPREVTKQIRDAGFTIRGQRETSIYNVFQSIIPTAAVLSGVLLAVLTIMADFFGVIGGGTGLLVTVTTIYQFYEQIYREYKTADA